MYNYLIYFFIIYIHIFLKFFSCKNINNLGNMNNLNSMENMNNLNSMNYLKIDTSSFNMLMNLINENIQMQKKIALNNNLINSIMNKFIPQIQNGMINSDNQNQELLSRNKNFKSFKCFPENNS